MSATAGQDLPLERLESWLRAHVEGFCGPVAAERFAGGQSNPTYRLMAASGHYMARQIARWSRQYRASETQTIAAMDRLIEWLPEHLPPESPPAIVHGDYRMDNLIFHKTEPRVIGVLDWELSTIGDPIADFAYHCLTWRVTPELFRGLAGIDFAGLGSPEEPAYVAGYCRRTGREAI